MTEAMWSWDERVNEPEQAGSQDLAPSRQSSKNFGNYLGFQYCFLKYKNSLYQLVSNLAQELCKSMTTKHTENDAHTNTTICIRYADIMSTP